MKVVPNVLHAGGALSLREEYIPLRSRRLCCIFPKFLRSSIRRYGFRMSDEITALTSFPLLSPGFSEAHHPSAPKYTDLCTLVRTAKWRDDNQTTSEVLPEVARAGRHPVDCQV